MDEVTNIDIQPVKPNKGLVAFVSFTYAGLILSSVAVYSKLDGSGYRVVYPDRFLPNGKKMQVFYPENREIGEKISNAITKKYEEFLNGIARNE